MVLDDIGEIMNVTDGFLSKDHVLSRINFQEDEASEA